MNYYLDCVHAYPSKRVFMNAVHKLNFGISENYLIERAYDMAERVHSHGPRRTSGEIYFWHPYRAALDAVHTQRHLGIRDHLLIICLLLHDGVEEAEKSEEDPRMVRIEIGFTFGKEVEYVVMCSTKNKKVEDGFRYLARIANTYNLLVLWGKCHDKYDNLKTLGAKPVENRHKKIAEYDTWFPHIYNKLMLVTERMTVQEKMQEEVRAQWLKLPMFLKKRNDKLRNYYKRELIEIEKARVPLYT